MSSAQRLPNAEPSEKIEYTVNQTAKVHRESVEDRRPSIWYSVVKWIVGIFLLISVLTCLVASKISLLSIACFHDPSGARSDTNRETIFIMVVLTLMLPEAVSFLKACWISLFRKNHKWPSAKAILVGLFAGVLEVFGLCFFAVVILLHREFPPVLRILMMNGVFIVPVIWQIVKNITCDREQCFSKELFLFILSLLLEIGGVGVIMYQVDKIAPDVVVWVIPFALVFISIAWCPKMFKFIMQPSGEQPLPVVEESVGMANTVELGGSIASSSPDIMILERVSKASSARGKAAIITSLWKLILIPFVAAFFCYIYHHEYPVADLTALRKGFDDFNSNHKAFPHFMAQIFTSFIGYVLGILACSMCMQRLAFAIPMFLATPVSVALALIPNENVILPFDSGEQYKHYLVYVAAGLLLLAQFIAVGYYLFKEQCFIMAKESSLFWMPTYNGVLLEQHLLLNRRNKVTDDYQLKYREVSKRSCIYICTTMYHEIEQEMEQLLNSLHDIDCARQKSKRQIESHIFFDGAIKGDVLNNYVLQLISLIPKTLKVKVDACMKLKTPYGMQMRWKLPGGMYFHVHLKDNLKVKNKKRWSQVMYMSYVLDFKEKTMDVSDENTYILTTDADVKFTHESVEALLDLMTRDRTVGAVCARTHPLGIGPIVWYQIFDYAIGHWFQKVANHVLGSVLCSPGCFSVYRAAAIRDVLPIYASKVDNSFDFLTKDMGEDRWLCTLMVQAGWRLEYCAAAEDSTYCPDNFDEFFKQRRRWIPSTLANLILLISQWKLTVDNNDYISFAFISYQALLVVSTILGPATVILILASGLSYAHFPIDDNFALVIILIIITVGYAIICLYTSQEFQLKTAKFLTVVFALLMSYALVGVVAQAGDDLYMRSHPPTPTPTPSHRPQPTPNASSAHTKSSAVQYLLASLNPTTQQIAKSTSQQTVTPTTSKYPPDGLPADISSLYLGSLIVVYLVAALLHPTEAANVAHGFWYLLCLPSGYLLLIVYSICNMTDRSWGTREEKSKKDNEVPWYVTLWKKMKQLCWCCRPEPSPPEPREPRAVSSVDGSPLASSSSSPTEENSSASDVQPSEDESSIVQIEEEKSGQEGTASSPGDEDGSRKLPVEAPSKSALKKTMDRWKTRDPQREDSGRLTKWRYPGDKKVTFSNKLPRLHPETSVEDWLQGEFLQLYLRNFKDNGYDNISFIAGMTDRDLKAIGIDKRGHRKKLVYAIEKLPQLDIAQEVPGNVEDWLTDIGLDEYWEKFEQSGYTEPRMLEDLKIMNKDTLKNDFGIFKPGHLDKLYKAVQKVQYPSESQRRIRRAREETNKIVVLDLKTDNQDDGLEYYFWDGLRQECLVPESAIFGAVEELKEKLEELRNSTLLVFAVSNLIWIILLLTLVRQEHLKVMGTNAIGFAFLAIYGFVIVIQFLTLLWHRMATFFHVVARAPWKRGALHMVWAFDDRNLPPPPDERILQAIRQQRGRGRPRRRRHTQDSRRLSFQGSEVSVASTSGERDPLLIDGRPPSQTGYGTREPGQSNRLPRLV